MALKGIVQFDYKAEAPDELSLSVGDVITNIKQVEDGWCEGFLKGRKGMFPDNFVKKEKLPSQTSRTMETVKTKKKAEVLRRMKVTFTYEPTNDDELSLEVGDIVDVLCDEEEGWARGQCKGKEGVFPTNFAVVHVEPAAAMATPEPQPQEDVKPEEPTQVPSKKVKGIGFGNIFGEGPIKLRQSSYGEADAEKKMNHEKAAKETVEKTSPVTPVKPVDPPIQSVKKSKPVEKCRVSFDYEADHEDELTLVKDDIVIILDKTSQDAGWWLGEIVDENGKRRRGVFPDNFVSPLPVAEEESEKSSPKETVKESKPADSKTPKSKTENKRGSALLPPEDKVPVATKSKVRQLTNSLKRPAPLAPPASSKPAHESQSDETNDVAAVVSSTKDDQKLTHYKRPGGPKNRRKPDTAGRRERAREAEEEVMKQEPEPEPEPETEPMEVNEKPAEPQTTPKRDTKRGIQVMPASGGTEAGGDAPSWLKNLRNRSSQKKPVGPMSVSPSKEEETPSEPATTTGPAWLSQLKKTKSGGQIGPGRPSMPATSPKPGPTKPVTSPTTNHTPPVRPPSPEKTPSTDKLLPMKTQEKEVESNKANSEQSDIKAELEGRIGTKTGKEAMKPPVKQVAMQPPKQLDKKPMPSAASKPKPPPPKAKPMLPGAKPSVVNMEEMKEEMRLLKDAMNAMQAEYRREFAKLNADLEDERSQRMILQAEVKRLSG